MPRTVLIVDDEPRITMALYVRLQAAGYTVFHAINGLAGIEAARLHRPNVIVLDIGMPDIDGVEVCQRLKADRELAEIPVIFLSGRSGQPDLLRALDAGGVIFIAKPYEASTVIRAVDIATRGRGQPREHTHA